MQFAIIPLFTHFNSLFVAIFYMLFLIATALTQIGTKLKSSIKKIDFLNFIPNYKFFCPRPLRNDHYIYYRVGYVLHSTIEWKKIEVDLKRNVISWLWNPQKRERKALSRTFKVLGRQYKKNGYVNEGYLYQQVLQYIKSKIDLDKVVTIQFKIIATSDLRPNLSQRDFFTSSVNLINLRPI